MVPLATEREREVDVQSITISPHLQQGLPPEVTFETQFDLTNMNKCSVYNEIMASIGLDSPTTSREKWGREDTEEYNKGKGGQVVNTPIRNNMASLMALGKDVLTPK